MEIPYRYSVFPFNRGNRICLRFSHQNPGIFLAENGPEKRTFFLENCSSEAFFCRWRGVNYGVWAANLCGDLSGVFQWNFGVRWTGHYGDFQAFGRCRRQLEIHMRHGIRCLGSLYG